MKKNVFLFMAAVATLASCSNDETMEVVQQQQAIGFKTFVDKPTRADADVTATSLQTTGFWVWADANATSSPGTYSQILKRDKTTFSSPVWESTTTRYWQPNYYYAFTAIGPAYTIVPSNDPLTYEHSVPTNDADFMTKLHGTITYDISKSKGKTDLVHAFASRAVGATLDGEAIKPVSLDFNHLLSKVTVEFKNSVGAANLLITGLTVTSAQTGSLILKDLDAAASKGDFTWTGLTGTYTTDALPVDQGALTDVGSGESVWVIPGSVAGTNAASIKPLYLLPIQTKIDISFTVQIYSGSEPGQSCTHTGSATISGGLIAGHSYKLTTTLDADNVLDDPLHPIKFTVNSVATWDEESENITLNP